MISSLAVSLAPHRGWKSACGACSPSLKPEPEPQEPPMIAIGTILIFIVAIGALNIYEFGRLD